MRFFLLLLLTTLISSCGKKSEDAQENKVTTTPPISVEDDPENIVGDERFSIKTDKAEFEAGEVIILKLKNMGQENLNHLSFKVTTSPSSAVVSKLNCFVEVAPSEECLFSVSLQNVNEEYQKITMTYTESGSKLDLTVKINATDPGSDVYFLHKSHHTFDDCKSIEKYHQKGIISSVRLEDFCKLRAKSWDAELTTEITEDPLMELNDPRIDSDQFYCKQGWTLHSFQFEESKVVEKTNIFGGKRDVIIPPGESREICVKRKLFGCKERKVFYSRLVSVKCY